MAREQRLDGVVHRQEQLDDRPQRAVLVLRRTHPELPRPFRCRWVYAVAPLGVGVNVYMMTGLPVETWVRLVAWLAVGLVLYFSYGRRHSALRRPGSP